MSEDPLYAVVRIRSFIGAPYDTKHTMRLLRLHRTHHATIIRGTQSVQGMLRKAKDYLTWGEIDADIIHHLLTKRGERIGRKKITDEFMAENTEYPTIMALSEAIVKGDAKFTNIPWLRPVLRLHPPRKGYKDTKQDFTNKGDQGYRAEAITKLLLKMS